MKKVILSVAALFAFGFASAQDVKESTGGKGFASGDVFISGGFGISSTKTGDVKSSSFEITPKVGFFVTESIAIGGKLGYSSDKAENAIIDTVDESRFTVGAFGRYYMTPASDFSVFGQLAFDYSTVDDKLADDQENEVGVGVGLGVSYFLSNNFAMEASWAGLGYTTNDNGGDGAESTDSFGLNVDLSSINLGLVYKF